jgi:hypothetical protein
MSPPYFASLSLLRSPFCDTALVIGVQSVDPVKWQDVFRCGGPSFSLVSDCKKIKAAISTFLFGRSITMTRSQNRQKKEGRLRAASQLAGKLSLTAAHCRSDGRLSALFWEIAIHVGNHKWIILYVQVCTANTSGRISKKLHRKPD